MKPHFYTLLDLVFPPSADERILRHVSDDAFAALYRAVPIQNNYLTLLSFTDPRVRAAVHLAKFHAHPRATKLLGRVLAHHLAETRTPYSIIPIPLSSTRIRKRGYNQTENIVRAANPAPPHQLCTEALVKIRHTEPQTSLTRAARLENVIDAFAVRDSQQATQQITGQHILLVDDVMTTGATLEAAKAALLPLSPASITLLALSH